jgi:hypothetical protein
MQPLGMLCSKREIRLWWAGQRFEKPGLWLTYWTPGGVAQRRILPIRKRKRGPKTTHLGDPYKKIIGSWPF